MGEKEEIERYLRPANMFSKVTNGGCAERGRTRSHDSRSESLEVQQLDDIVATHTITVLGRGSFVERGQREDHRHVVLFVAGGGLRLTAGVLTSDSDGCCQVLGGDSGPWWQRWWLALRTARRLNQPTMYPFSLKNLLSDMSVNLNVSRSRLLLRSLIMSPGWSSRTVTTTATPKVEGVRVNDGGLEG